MKARRKSERSGIFLAQANTRASFSPLAAKGPPLGVKKIRAACP